MSEKFNSGFGAVICDGPCRKILLEGKLASGGFEHVRQPVVIYVRLPESDERLAQFDFCSAACAHAYCQSSEPEPAERQQICIVLAGHYAGTSASSGPNPGHEHSVSNSDFDDGY